MLPPYTPPDPTDFADLLQDPTFQHPTQQPILRAYAAGHLEIETLVYRLLEEALERAPLVSAQAAEAAEARATQRREEAEMAANEKAVEPTFVACSPDGRPLAAGKN